MPSNLTNRCLEPRLELALYQLLPFTQRTSTITRLLGFSASDKDDGPRERLKSNIKRILVERKIQPVYGNGGVKRGTEPSYESTNFLRGPRERRHAAILLGLQMRHMPPETYTADATPSHVIAGRPDPFENITALITVFKRYLHLVGDDMALTFEKFLVVLDALEAGTVSKSVCSCCGSLVLTNTITQRGLAECPTCTTFADSIEGAYAIFEARARRASAAATNSGKNPRLAEQRVG